VEQGISLSGHQGVGHQVIRESGRRISGKQGIREQVARKAGYQVISGLVN